MEITSGGGGRSRLDPSLASLDNNLYGLLYGARQPETLAPLLVANGRSARRAAWDEFEMTKVWCSFLLVSSGGQVKFSGVV